MCHLLSKIHSSLYVIFMLNLEAVDAATLFGKEKTVAYKCGLHSNTNKELLNLLANFRKILDGFHSLSETFMES